MVFNEVTGLIKIIFYENSTPVSGRQNQFGEDVF